MSGVRDMVADCRANGHVYCPDEGCTCPCHDTAEERDQTAAAMARCRSRCTGEPYDQALEVIHRSLARSLAFAFRPYD